MLKDGVIPEVTKPKVDPLVMLKSYFDDKNKKKKEP
jgi:hypothetical protein